MAEALLIEDTTYAGEADLDFYLLRPVVTMDTYEKNAIVLKGGIKKQHTIDRLEVSNFIQDRAATPTSAGSIVIDYKQLIPQDFMMYMEFNPRDFETNWFAQELEALLIDRQLPYTSQDFLVLQLMKRVNQYYEYAIWNSRKAYNPNGGTETVPSWLTAAALNNNFYYFDGLVEKALLDANTIQVPSAVALTPLNIRAAFDSALALVPQALIGKYGPMGLRVLVSNKDWLKYNQALREDAFKNQNTTERNQDEWAGFDVVRCAGIPENTFFMCLANPDPTSGNAFIGVNEWGDKDNLKLSIVQNNSELWFLKGLHKVDVNWGFTDQLVMYTTATA